MKGLIRKDFYLLWSYCRLMPLFLLAFIIFSAFSSDGQSPFFIYYPCILSSVLPVNLLAYDDAEHWLTYCDTLPVTRAAIRLRKVHHEPDLRRYHFPAVRRCRRHPSLPERCVQSGRPD